MSMGHSGGDFQTGRQAEIGSSGFGLDSGR